MRRIAIVGGGISGLTAAWALQRGAAQRREALEVRLFESSPRLGGQIRTWQHDGIPLEGGPDSLVLQKPAGVELCNDLGLQSEIIRVEGQPRLELLHRGRLVPVPQGFAMMAPSRLGPLLRSPLFSLRGKLRILAERWLPGSPPPEGDESLRSFVTRRVGREAFERVAEPIMAGLFVADADRMSLQSTMPRFLELERRAGSVIKGLRRAAKSACPARGGLVTLRDGMGRLVRRLTREIAEPTLNVGVAVDGVSHESNRWRLELRQDEPYVADALVLACPSSAAARLLHATDPDLAQMLGEIDFASCATVNLLYSRSQLSRDFRSHGFFVPRTEPFPLLACSFVSHKFAGRWPDDRVLIRGFLGGVREPEVLEHDDDRLVERTHEALAGLLGIQGDPAHARVHRCPSAMPQLAVGHQRRIAGLRKQAATHPSLWLCGSAVGAIGLPDCIRSGRETAERLLEGGSVETDMQVAI